MPTDQIELATLVVVSFSNRMFYQKAIAAWRDGSKIQRVELVKRYLRAVPGFSRPEVIAEQSDVPMMLPLLGLGGGDPFYAVMAERMESLIKVPSPESTPPRLELHRYL